MTDGMRQRVAARLTSLNRNPFSAARLGGLDRGYISQWLSGQKKSITLDRLPAMAKALDWSVMELLNERRLDQLPIRGIVEAGAWRDPSDSSAYPALCDVPLDRKYAADSQFAMVVRGHSMNDARPFPIIDGSIIRCVELEASGVSIKGGLIVVCERTSKDGTLVERSLKRVLDIDGDLELHSESTSSRHRPIPIVGAGKQKGDGIRIIAIITAVLNEFHNA